MVPVRGQIVAWSLKVTDLDPLKLDLLFERFLNPERINMPDFDVDFCQENRYKTIEYVQNKYGFDHVAQIITYGKLQSKAVIRDVARVLQMPYAQADRISKMIPPRCPREKPDLAGISGSSVGTGRNAPKRARRSTSCLT